MSNPPVLISKNRKGMLDQEFVRKGVFTIVSICILVSLVAAIMAVWQFTGRDVLWRTITTCVLVAFAAFAFSLVNLAFGQNKD
jgi:hypothetical protein